MCEFIWHQLQCLLHISRVNIQSWFLKISVYINKHFSVQNCWCGIFIARCCFSSCCTLCNDVIRGRCGGLFQASGGSANGIFVASVLLSIQAICPKRERCLCWMVDLKSHNLTLTEALDMAENCSFSGCWQRLALRTVVQPNSDDDEMLFAL